MINNKKILAVVTARGGSKGVPFKNVKTLLGKPLFLWSVLQGLNSKYIDKTVVSSNCDKVFSEFHNFSNKNPHFAENNKLKFIQRPDEISTDTSKNEDALIHAIHWKRDIFKEEYDIILNLQPTSPCRLDNLIDKCIELYENGGYDSLLTGNKITPFLWRKEEKWIYNVDKNDCCDRKMRQQFREDEFLYHDCGSIYLIKKDILLEKKCRIGYNPAIYEVDYLNSLQIDTEFDFDLIENMLKARNINSLI